jgi:hypothetical protein
MWPKGRGWIGSTYWLIDTNASVISGTPGKNSVGKGSEAEAGAGRMKRAGQELEPRLPCTLQTALSSLLICI